LPYRTLFLLFCFGRCVPLVTAQIINPTVDRAGVTLDHQSARADETISCTVTLNAAANKATAFVVQFGSTTDGFNSTEFTVPAGATTATVSAKIPEDAQTGTYTLLGLIVVGERLPRRLDIPALKLHVDAIPSSVAVPTGAVVQIDLTQQQYLRQQAEPIRALRDNLIGYLDKHASETDAVKQELISTLRSADALLPEVRRKYVALYLKPPALSPVMFDDFHVRYMAALVELGAPPAPGTSQTASGRPALIVARTIYVQLKTRPTSPPPLDDGWKKGPLSGTYPLLAVAALDLMESNIRAYLLVASRGSDTFTIRLASIPSGAAVSYKRVGEDYTYLSRQTNIDSATFPYAIWTFRFEKGGCKTETRTPNPYIEDSPDLAPELSCNGK
jgi:hypothetical protein